MSKTGGLAFPATTAEGTRYSGMTLLDYFAGQAIAGVMPVLIKCDSALACPNSNISAERQSDRSERGAGAGRQKDAHRRPASSSPAARAGRNFSCPGPKVRNLW